MGREILGAAAGFGCEPIFVRAMNAAIVLDGEIAENYPDSLNELHEHDVNR